MGFLSDLVLARDLIRDAVAGVRELNSAIGQGSMAPLGPGGAPFGPFPAIPPGQGNPAGAPGGLRPFVQAGTILVSPSGQPIGSGWGSATISGGAGGGGGGGSRTGLAGAGGGVGMWSGATMSGGSGGGGGGGSRTVGVPGGWQSTQVLGALTTIAMELRGLRNDQQRDVTGLRAKGLT